MAFITSRNSECLNIPTNLGETPSPLVEGRAMGKASKDKGKRGEREVANFLKSYGIDASRGQQFCGINGDADVIGLDGFHIEVKRVEAFKLYEAMEQSKRDARDGEIPTVWHRKNNHDWVVVIGADDFMKLLGREQE